jgi:hypothetical protein
MKIQSSFCGLFVNVIPENHRVDIVHYVHEFMLTIKKALIGAFFSIDKVDYF